MNPKANASELYQNRGYKISQQEHQDHKPRGFASVVILDTWEEKGRTEDRNEVLRTWNCTYKHT